MNGIQKLVLGASLFIVTVVAWNVASSFSHANTVEPGKLVYQEDATDPYPFEVRQSETYKMIGMRLENEGFIADDRDFNQYIRQHHLQNRIREGEYLLSPAMSIEEITDRLISAQGALRTFHVYDGVNLEQIAEVFESRQVMDQDVFWSLVEEGDFSSYDFIGPPDGSRTRLEGFLYPGHYEYRESDTPQEILEMMLDRFERNIATIDIQNDELSLVEIVNLASLIEKEAANEEEKPLIASVYMNRLAIGQPLQCDATVVYAMDVKKETLQFSDYQIQSPYNTYLIQGLPPTPIASPGLTSLQAAAAPAETDYYYYLLDTKDYQSHIFAKDYDEHLENRATYGYDG